MANNLRRRQSQDYNWVQPPTQLGAAPDMYEYQHSRTPSPQQTRTPSRPLLLQQPQPQQPQPNSYYNNHPQYNNTGPTPPPPAPLIIGSTGTGGYGYDDPYYSTDSFPHHQDDRMYAGGPGSDSSHTALNIPQHQQSYMNQQQDYYPPQRSPPRINSPYHQPQFPGAPSFPPQPQSPYMMPQPMYSPTIPFYQNPQYQQEHKEVMARREKKKVELVDGNLRLEIKQPETLLKVASGNGKTDGVESQYMTYTAITCDPDDFTACGYKVRQIRDRDPVQKFERRSTELFICMTMYNEDEKLFVRTFTSVVKNIQHLVARSKSRTWGADSWKKVVVCVISDGRSKINPRTLQVLGLMGAYQEGIMKDFVGKEQVQAHLFETTTNVVVNDMGGVSGGISPVQVLFCLKEQNKKKLNSHRWAFNAFCRQLNPNVCVLLDVGTRPGGTSIYALWKAFDKNRTLGGACGEITVDTGRGCSNLLNPLVAAQNFEYKMSNILDKSLESVFGYISVLPGAFSAYRYKALLDEANGEGPLKTYFLGEKMHEENSIASLADSNMYLAEDRILCFEIVCKRSQPWTLKYVKSAKASTDVPNTVPEFISQRRRWMNGSFFAALHATTHYYRVWTSGQSFLRKLWLSILFLYNFIQLFFSFFGLSSFYLAFFFLCDSATSNPAHDPFGGHGLDVISVANSLFIGTIGVTIVCALGNKPQGSKWWYVLCMTVFSALFLIALYCTGWTIWLAVPHTLAGWKNIKSLLDESAFRDIVISIGSTYGLYIIASLLHAEPWHLFTSFLQYMLLLPSFIIVLTIYSFSNLQDLAWGTKGSTGVGNEKAKVTGSDGKGPQEAEIEITTKPEDQNILWQNMQKELRTPYVEQHQKRSIDAKKTDHYANIRTNTLLVYLGSNMIIVIFFSSQVWLNFVAAHTSTKPVVNMYMVGIFWSVAALSAFRFIGSTLYLLLRLVGL